MRLLPLVPFLLLAAACGETSPTPIADPILARAGSVEVSQSQYRAYLHEAIGERHLERLVLRQLVEAEAAKLGVGPVESSVETAIELAWDVRLRRSGGDEFAARRALIDEGRHDFRSWERAIGAAERQRVLEEAICRATRVIDEASLQNAFELRYGKDGLVLRARGVVLDSARVEEELARSAPAGVDREEVLAETERRGAQVRHEIEAGEPLRTVVERYSHDPYGLRHGGELGIARIQALEQELRSVPIGTVHGPILQEREDGRFDATIFVVEERVFTAFEEVRETLQQELQNAPVRAEERAALAQRLLEESPISLP